MNVDWLVAVFEDFVVEYQLKLKRKKSIIKGTYIRGGKLVYIFGTFFVTLMHKI